MTAMISLVRLGSGFCGRAAIWMSSSEPEHVPDELPSLSSTDEDEVEVGADDSSSEWSPCPLCSKTPSPRFCRDEQQVILKVEFVPFLCNRVHRLRDFRYPTRSGLWWRGRHWIRPIAVRTVAPCRGLRTLLFVHDQW